MKQHDLIDRACIVAAGIPETDIVGHIRTREELAAAAVSLVLEIEKQARKIEHEQGRN